MSNFKNSLKVGDTYGRLTISKLEYRRLSKANALCCECNCTCGNIKWIFASNIKRKNTVSCGCLRKENSLKQGYFVGSNKGVYPVLWRRYSGMISRCYNSNQKSYQYYGGRGIKVCEKWKNSYPDYHQYILSLGWIPGKSIDRIDNNGNYEPGNIRLADSSVQANNKRNNRKLSIFGEIKTLAQWSRDERCLVSYNCLKYRTAKGWNSLKALTTPARAIKSK